MGKTEAEWSESVVSFVKSRMKTAGVTYKEMANRWRIMASKRQRLR